jgi:hypothetical protein
MRISVVFPHPDGPRKTTSEFLEIEKEESDTTGTCPNDLVTRSNVRKSFISLSPTSYVSEIAAMECPQYLVCEQAYQAYNNHTRHDFRRFDVAPG